MQIIVSIHDVRQRYDAENNRVLANLGLNLEDLVAFAFGFMVGSMQRHRPPSQFGLRGHDDIFTQVARLLNDQLPSDGQLVYARNHPSVHRVVDMIGEISQILADDVVRQIGHVPAHLQLHRFIGPDLILSVNEDYRERSVRYRLPAGRAL